jgi:hypothetical protein
MNQMNIHQEIYLIKQEAQQVRGAVLLLEQEKVYVLFVMFIFAKRYLLPEKKIKGIMMTTIIQSSFPILVVCAADFMFLNASFSKLVQNSSKLYNHLIN